MRNIYPYEITKLYDTKINPETKEKEIVLERNYAYAIDQNFKAIQKYNPTFQFTLPVVLTVGENQPPATPVPFNRTAIEIYAYVKTAPSSSAFIAEVNKNGSPIGTVTIPIGSNIGQTAISENLYLGDLLTIDINQTDGIASDLTIQVRT